MFRPQVPHPYPSPPTPHPRNSRAVQALKAHTNSAFIRTRFSHPYGFTTSKPRQNRCGLEMFTRIRFPQKIEVVIVQIKASAALRAKFTILNRTMQISAKIVTVFKSMRFSLFTRQMKAYRSQNAPLLAAFSN